jgi:hypothetical protein
MFYGQEMIGRFECLQDIKQEREKRDRCDYDCEDDCPYCTIDTRP